MKILTLLQDNVTLVVCLGKKSNTKHVRIVFIRTLIYEGWFFWAHQLISGWLHFGNIQANKKNFPHQSKRWKNVKAASQKKRLHAFIIFITLHEVEIKWCISTSLISSSPVLLSLSLIFQLPFNGDIQIFQAVHNCASMSLYCIMVCLHSFQQWCQSHISGIRI